MANIIITFKIFWFCNFQKVLKMICHFWLESSIIYIFYSKIDSKFFIDEISVLFCFRYISFVTAEQNLQEFGDLLNLYKERGGYFIERISRSISIFKVKFERKFENWRKGNIFPSLFRNHKVVFRIFLLILSITLC